ncbi:MAG: hypothetical protein NZ699_14800 [Roseiflexus sp.]|nr:hypothetical protein [Roseiflexus sp.]MCS7290398.1 hypothetical protein [Roseiflexus sp.]MDW8232768.1 hypothetical protein [Roseiflexaceae bacterium]
MTEQPIAEHQEEAEAHENHELPRGALLITLTYLAILAGLWIQVYLQLLANGGGRGGS